jgi:hypothetical protein
MLQPDSDYFETQTHDYLELSWDELSNYIFKNLDFKSFYKGNHNAIELGPGSGRFTQPLIDYFKHVTLVEPSKYFCTILEDKFTTKGINVSNESLESYLDRLKKSSNNSENVSIFGFHLLHHLNQKERKALYSFIRDSNSVCFLVDPYYLNPLILLQILITPQMKFKEEYQYLKINKRSLKRDIAPFRLKLLSYRPIVPVAPFLMQKLLQNKRFATITILERIVSLFPFLFSYHAYIITREENEI